MFCRSDTTALLVCPTNAMYRRFWNWLNEPRVVSAAKAMFDMMPNGATAGLLIGALGLAPSAGIGWTEAAMGVRSGPKLVVEIPDVRVSWARFTRAGLVASPFPPFRKSVIRKVHVPVAWAAVSLLNTARAPTSGRNVPMYGAAPS